MVPVWSADGDRRVRSTRGTGVLGRGESSRVATGPCVGGACRGMVTGRQSSGVSRTGWNPGRRASSSRRITQVRVTLAYEEPPRQCAGVCFLDRKLRFSQDFSVCKTPVVQQECVKLLYQLEGQVPRNMEQTHDQNPRSGHGEGAPKTQHSFADAYLAAPRVTSRQEHQFGIEEIHPGHI